MISSKSIFGIFLIAFIFIATAWLGISIATDQLGTLIYVFGAGALITCALLGRRIWMTLPFAMALNITLQIPGQNQIHTRSLQRGLLAKHLYQ